MYPSEYRTRRFSRAEYERLIDRGVFQPGEPIELIGGELLVAEPQSAAHYTVVPGGPDDYGRGHPSRPALTVEVAESSRGVDRQHKGSLYDRVLEVYRDPAPDSAAPFGWRYARREVLDASARVTPLAAPGSSILVSLLLP